MAWDEMILDLAPTRLSTGIFLRLEWIGRERHVGQTGARRLERFL